jgi:hypothetical protein
VEPGHRLPDVLDAPDYAQALNEIDLYHYKLPVGRYTDDDIRKFGDGSDPFRYPNTDWYGETIKPWSPQGNANISLSGGNPDGVTYFVSAGNTWEDGYFRNSAVGYKQYNFRANIDAKIRKNINLRFDVSGRLEARQYTQERGDGTFRILYGMKPTEPAFWPKRSTDEERLPGPILRVAETRLSLQQMLPDIITAITMWSKAMLDWISTICLL